MSTIPAVDGGAVCQSILDRLVDSPVRTSGRGSSDRSEVD